MLEVVRVTRTVVDDEEEGIDRSVIVGYEEVYEYDSDDTVAYSFDWYIHQGERCDIVFVPVEELPF